MENNVHKILGYMETCGFSDADDHKVAGLTSVIFPVAEDNL